MTEKINNYCKLHICNHVGTDECLAYLTGKLDNALCELEEVESASTLACTMLEEYGMTPDQVGSASLHKRIEALGIMRGKARVAVAHKDMQISSLVRQYGVDADNWKALQERNKSLTRRCQDLRATVKQQSGLIEAYEENLQTSEDPIDTSGDEAVLREKS